MDNHYHLLIETPEANLVSGMRRLNGVYTQAFNRKHKRVGHVFQGRYIAQAQRLPARPKAREIIEKVSQAYHISPKQLFDRTHPEPYWAAVYLLRRAVNLPLNQVAAIAGISPGRVAQIQAKLDKDRESQKLSRLLKQYNV